jgi:hypothetical protein
LRAGLLQAAPPPPPLPAPPSAVPRPVPMCYLRCDGTRCQNLYSQLSSSDCGRCKQASRRARRNRPASQRIPCQASLCYEVCGHQQRALRVQRAPEGRPRLGHNTALRPCRAQWTWLLSELRCRQTSRSILSRAAHVTPPPTARGAPGGTAGVPAAAQAASLCPLSSTARRAGRCAADMLHQRN